MYKYAEIEYLKMKLNVILYNDNGKYSIKDIYLPGNYGVNLLDTFQSLYFVDGGCAADKIESLALDNAHF